MSKYLFGDLVHEVKEKVDRQNNPYEFFIAGDHMDTDELHLLRRGTFAGSDVGPAFIRVFKPGQVLYGSRRTYLRKVAVADFEGVTANTTFVLETKNESILIQQLLPFIMQSERFVQHSIKRSKGSTNPYVLFSDLCDYEIDLPNIETQKRLAEVLWTMDEVRMAYKKLIAATDELVKSQFIEMFIGKGYSTNKLSEVCTVITDGTHKTPVYQEHGITFISAKNIIDGKVDFTDVKYISQIEYQEIQKRCRTEAGDILLTKSGTLGAVALVDTDQPLGLFESLALLKYDREQLNGIFLKEQLRSSPIQLRLLSEMKGVAVKHLHLNVISKTEIVVPPLTLQQKFATFVRQSDKSKFELEQALSELTATYKCIISEQLG